MKKLINAVETVLAESLDGFAAAHADIVALGDGAQVRPPHARLTPGKVALISGGGSGHEPLHAGFVGLGMLDAACPGQVFTSPTPDQMVAAAEAVDTGAGCLFIVKNYEGDVMNFDMAAEMAGGREIADRRHRRRRRGRELDLHDRPARRRRHAGRREDRRAPRPRHGARPRRAARRSGERVNGRTRSMGVALTSCTVPAAGNADLRRSARTRWRWASASMASRAAGASSSPAPTPSPTRCWEPILADLAPQPATAVLLLVNGFGGTPAMELYLMVNSGPPHPGGERASRSRAPWSAPT